MNMRSAFFNLVAMICTLGCVASGFCAVGPITPAAMGKGAWIVHLYDYADYTDPSFPPPAAKSWGHGAYYFASQNGGNGNTGNEILADYLAGTAGYSTKFVVVECDIPAPNAPSQLTPDLVTKMHDAGIQVLAYTLLGASNVSFSAAAADQAIRDGVDGLVVAPSDGFYALKYDTGAPKQKDIIETYFSSIQNCLGRPVGFSPFAYISEKRDLPGYKHEADDDLAGRCQFVMPRLFWYAWNQPPHKPKIKDLIDYATTWGTVTGLSVCPLVQAEWWWKDPDHFTHWPHSRLHEVHKHGDHNFSGVVVYPLECMTITTDSRGNDAQGQPFKSDRDYFETEIKTSSKN